MRHAVFLPCLIAVLLGVGSACTTGRGGAASQKTPVLGDIVGSVRLHEDAGPATTTTVQIVVMLYNHNERSARRMLENVGTLSKPFSLSVRWPDSKGSPRNSVEVQAFGYEAGQLSYISDSQRYTTRDSLRHRPLEFVLAPVRE
jgi:hypothetical protein